MSMQTKHLIETQIPYHIREVNPLFTKFLEYYYEFVEQSSITDIIQDIRRYNDIDEVDESFLMDFFEEFRKIPNTVAADRRLIAKNIYDLYKSKGTEAGLKLLFRMVYGETINVFYPFESVLKASDGRWVQENIVNAVTLEGSVQSTSNRIQWGNQYGTFDFPLKKTESYVTGETRFFFETKDAYHFNDNEIIYVYTNDTLDYTGRVEVMPSEILIEGGGQYWQVGQVIVLPGSIRPTICQVKRVGAGGAITKVDIIEYGYGYTTDEIFIVSPYTYRPESSYTEAYTEKVSDVPLAFAHTLNIFEYTDGLGESILGLDSNQEYVIEGYVLQDYINRKSIVETVLSDTDTGIVNDEISIEQWLQSRARLRIINRNSARTAGFYEDFRGMPSAPDIRLQDNFYYQLFSYVIETEQLLSDHEPLLKMVHPAGMKYFSNLAKITTVDVGATVNRILSRETILVSDTVSAEELSGNGIGKGLTARAEDFVKPTTLAVANNYDANNELEFYDVAVDWDEITPVTVQSGSYDAEGYDSAEYNLVYGTEYDLQNYDAGSYEATEGPYTQEDENITVQKN
jgi:hypothetical protein